MTVKTRQQILDESWLKAKAHAKRGNEAGAIGEILAGFLRADAAPDIVHIGVDFGIEHRPTQEPTG